MRFKYAAKTRDGSAIKRGEIDAPNREGAVQWLKENDLVVYSLSESKSGGFFDNLSPFKKITLNDKVKFTDQLASMVSAGLPLTKSLEILSSQTSNKQLREVTKIILNDVESGSPLASALDRRPDIFPTGYVSLVKAGEASGKLDEVLSRLAENLEKERSFRSKVKGAMLYPAIVTIAMAMVFVLIIVFLIPKMTSLYESFQVELPITTKILIAISDFTINYWYILLAGIIGLIIGFRIFKKTPQGDLILSKFFLRVPIFGNLIRQSTIVEITRSMGLLSEAGVPLTEALDIVTAGLNNQIFRSSMVRVTEDVRRGFPLSQTISKEDAFPVMVSQMLMVGEETGSVDARLNGLANYYDGEVDKIVRNLSTAMEPIIMIMLGVLVGLLVVSVVMPIYQLTSQFG